MAGRRSTGAAHDGPGSGDVVAGVRLTALVGEGGAAAVWSGTEVATGARVAVKLVRGVDATREAALLSAVRHPHVLPLRRVCADPPALVTDLAAGGSLAAQVAARGTLTPGEVVTVLAPLADALAALHAHGVVHGDLTATNVLFVDRGRPVLADLGVAGLAGDGAAWATPGYAAPEVLAGARPGPAADVHGLGAAAWLALTGTVPPVEADRLPLRLLAPDCPDGLVDAVTAALDPDPARRPAPDELAAAARASCPGVAVRLVPAAALGVRPDEAVTSRVREAAAADLDRGAERGWWRRLRLVVGRVGAVVRRGSRALHGPRHDRPPGRRALVAGGVGGLGLAVVSAVVVAGAVAVVPGVLDTGVFGQGDRTVAGPAGPQPQDAAPVAGTVDGAAPPGPVDPGGAAGAVPPPGDAAGPGDLRAAVTGLVEARERALRAGDAAALAQVHHPDGLTLAADRALVGAGPLDVGYEVVGVRSLPGRPDAADVELRTTTAGVTVVEEVVIEMAAGPDGWRVRSVNR